MNAPFADTTVIPAQAGLYRYDEIDRRFLAERVAQFREQVERRLSGALSEDEFKPLRLMNGLYLQLHAYMLRVAVPYGLLSSRQLRQLAYIARRYDRGYGHFTTRQNIQYNWIKLGEAPDILADLAAVDMHAIQTSGNCIRNVTSDPFAGAAADEVADPRIYAEILRQWSTLHPEFSFLPRKFKIAITGAPEDRAAILLHDIGIRVKRDGAGQIGFEVYVGGGQGRTPMIAVKARDFLPEEEFLGYMEAILRTYNRLGRRDNIYKARIKIMVQEMGQEAFLKEIEDEYAAMPRTNFRLAPEVVEAIASHFAPPVLPRREGARAAQEAAMASDPAFARWVRSNVTDHRDADHAVVTISLKPPGGIPGDATSEQMELVADLADELSLSEIRVAYEQNLVLAHVGRDALHGLYKALEEAGLGTPNIGQLSDIIACPGLDYCSLANARSIPIAQRLSERFADPALAEEVGRLGIKISGCINACGHHHVGAIGILGVDRKGEEAYQLTLGGHAGDDASIGQVVGPAFTAEAVIDAVDTIVRHYLEIREPGEAFLATVRRVGIAPFKERIHGNG